MQLTMGLVHACACAMHSQKEAGRTSHKCQQTSLLQHITQDSSKNYIYMFEAMPKICAMLRNAYGPIVSFPRPWLPKLPGIRYGIRHLLQPISPVLDVTCATGNHVLASSTTPIMCQGVQHLPRHADMVHAVRLSRPCSSCAPFILPAATCGTQPPAWRQDSR